MRIAFLIAVHKVPSQVAELCRFLSAEGDSVFVHVDKSVDPRPFEQAVKGLERVEIIPDRYTVSWGGFSQVQATNALIEAAIPGKFDYYYFLSGQCFPIRSLAWLKDALSAGRDHIDWQAMPTPTKPMSRLHRRRFNRKNTSYKVKRLVEAALNLRPVPDFQGKFGMAPHAGSSWWCLSRDTIEYIRDFRAKTPAYDRYMRWTHCPDEMYYQTLVANRAGGRPRAERLTGDVWVEGEAHPKMLTQADLPDLMKRTIFIARKFDEDQIDAIKTQLHRSA